MPAATTDEYSKSCFEIRPRNTATAAACIRPGRRGPHSFPATPPPPAYRTLRAPGLSTESPALRSRAPAPSQFPARPRGCSPPSRFLRLECVLPPHCPPAPRNSTRAPTAERRCVFSLPPNLAHFRARSPDEAHLHTLIPFSQPPHASAPSGSQKSPSALRNGRLFGCPPSASRGNLRSLTQARMPHTGPSAPSSACSKTRSCSARNLHRFGQIFVEPHKDPGILVFSPGPVCLQILPHDRLNLDFLVRALERFEIHFAISLPAVRVADPDQPAFLKDLQIKSRARLQLVQIHIRPVLPRPQRARSSLVVFDGRPRLFFRLVRIHARRQNSRKRLQVERHARFELRPVRGHVQLVVPHKSVQKFLRQQPRRKILPRKIEILSVLLRHDFQDADLQGVSRLRAVHENRPRNRVRAAAVILLPQARQLVHVRALQRVVLRGRLDLIE